MCDQEFRTLRIDPRYPFQNQTRACYDNYCDYYKCTRLLGDVDDCKIFKRYFETICPNFWIEHWDELRGKGAFPGPI
ncbi:cytochrome c oxidase subunit 6B1-like [Colias croceus]|uniref:cytochrome c oxidase subunit 6B1-like n=1 Tax=Colias crocea TaxID=72248 RepID=UPI001E27E0A1|nr:cytochrome c oxidase subunit 6B1-like [Colias croceus]CAG4950964.1 unnamed protein product [Colias eurytheme]